MTTSRPAKAVALACLGVPLLALAYCLLMSLMFNSPPFHPNPFDTLQFNQHDWLEDRSCEDGSNRRGHMADDIIRHRLRLGMAEAQVVALLGSPDHVYTRAQVQHELNACKQGDTSETYFHPRDLQAAKVDDYYLGEELSMGQEIDRAWLYLYMDPQGRYIGYRIHSP